MGLYIQVHSMHGLIRAQNIELGRDEDTGGQVLYVKYLATELGRLAGVDRVDLVTRRIVDPEYPGYDAPEEAIIDNVRIVRIDCGPERYIKKVDLWPHVDQYVDNCCRFIDALGRTPDILHSNYADAGLACARLSERLGVPQVHTGHSLGKPKMARLGITDQNLEEFERIYHFKERYAAEQRAIDNAAAIIVSTDEERLHQYNRYHVDITDPRFRVVPPGVNTVKIHPADPEHRTEEDERARQRILGMLAEALDEPEKPALFTISRLDYRKNLSSLVKAFVYDRELQEAANLVLVTGSLGKMGKNQEQLMAEIESLVGCRQCHGKICIIRKLDYETEVGEMYRLMHDLHGVFVNPAFHEPFGITVLEAGATGVPVVATNNGGPVEIIEQCDCGRLVDPRDTGAIAAACRELLNGTHAWERYAQNGMKNVPRHYSWANTARQELAIFEEILARR